MNDTEFRQKLAKLQAKLAIHDAQVMANPKPYLEMMYRECMRIIKVLDEVEYALSGAAVYDFWEEHVDKKAIPQPANIQGEALIRCNKALDILRSYKLDK